MGIITWLILGLIAGWLAGVVMKGGGYGIVGDIVIGIVGAFLGGLLWAFLFGHRNAVNNFDLGSIFVAFVGAVILIALLRAVTGSRAV